MSSLAEVEAFRGAVDDVSTLSIAELLGFWRSLDLGDAVPSVVALREFFPALVESWAPVAAEVAASFYDEARVTAGAAGTFDAVLAALPEAGKLQGLVSWAAEPLFREAADAPLALSRMTASSSLTVSDAARETIVFNTESDPASPRYARHASASACAFCITLATRGPVYTSESSARRSHSHCHCVAVPVWGDEYEAAPYVKDWQAAYKSVTRMVGSSDPKKVLAGMRQVLGVS